YAQLAAEGWLQARVGSGTRVRPLGAAAAGRPAPDAPPARAPRIDLAPGLPDLRSFPLGRWVGALRSVASTLPYAELGYPDPSGHPRVRRVRAESLARVRGAQVDPELVTVCRGVADGTGRVCQALRAAGVGAVAVEDPGWHQLRQAAASAGLRVVPTRVDAQGLRVGDLDIDPEVRAVIVSPTHQFPTGVVLSASRRAARLAWARRVDGLILEDDYDAEYRYDRRPVGTIQGTDPSRVALLGSLSKTLSPALGIGWVVTPPAWTGASRRRRSDDDHHSQQGARHPLLRRGPEPAEPRRPRRPPRPQLRQLAARRHPAWASRVPQRGPCLPPGLPRPGR